MKKPPKRHHYVPEMLQNRFTDENGILHAFRKDQSSRGVFPSKPTNLFVEGHLYRQIEKDGTPNTKMETKFSQLETHADLVISKIITAARMDKQPNLSLEEKEVWYRFLYMQWKRVPDLHKVVNTPIEADFLMII